MPEGRDWFPGATLTKAWERQRAAAMRQVIRADAKRNKRLI
jgi:hypothetical protein